jgi:hypothetical protein
VSIMPRINAMRFQGRPLFTADPLVDLGIRREYPRSQEAEMAELRSPRGRLRAGAGGWCRRRFGVAVVAALPLLTLVASCSTLGPDSTAAAGVAAAFHRAVQDGNGNAACAFLAPATMEELEGTSGQSCPDAVLSQDLPDAGDVQDSQAFGRGAQVLMDDDAVFLALFDDRWLITAAGCTPRGDLPYDCSLKGG